MKLGCEKMLRKLGLTLIKDGNHVKCKDENGKIYIFSQNYLKQALDNPRFAKLTNKAVWLKNRREIDNESLSKML